MNAPIVEYEINAATIREWGAKYSGLTCDDAEGYEETRKAIAVLRSTRTGIEKRRVELKKDALEYGRRVDSVAKALTAEYLTRPHRQRRQLRAGQLPVGNGH